MSPPETITLYKETLKTSLGFSLNMTHDGTLIVTKVTPGGLASKTNLKPGMVVMKLNDMDCTKFKTHSEAANVIRKTEGELAVLAKEPGFEPGATIIANLEKSEPGPVGLGLGKASSGKLVITSISPDGLAAKSDLDVGMILTRINKTDIGTNMTPAQAAMRLKKAEGVLRLLAQVPEEHQSFRIPKTDSEREVKQRSSSMSHGDRAAASVATADSAAAPAGKVKSSQSASGDLLTVTIEKEFRAQLGVGLGKSARTDQIVVTHIKEDGLVAKTDLKPGMTILKIDDTEMKGQTPQQASALLRNAHGKVKIVASVPQGMRYKEHTVMIEKEFRSPLGVAVGRSEDDQLMLTTVKPESLGEQAGLKPNMIVRSIDGTTITKNHTPKQCSTLLRNAHGKFAIVVATPPMDPGMSMRTYNTPRAAAKTIVVEKDFQAPVGMVLGRSSKDELVITNIKPGSLLEDTEARQGMILKSVNGADVGGMAPTEVSKVLKEASGTVTIVVQDREVMVDESQAGTSRWPAGHVMTCVLEKEDRNSKVGLGLGRLSNGNVVVTSVREDGLAAQNENLETGLILKSINGVDCNGLTSVEAAQMLKDSESTVTLVVEVPPAASFRIRKSQTTAAAPASRWPAGSLVTVVVEKTEDNSKVGLGLGRSSNGKVLITSIRDGSLAQHTDLEVGMILKTVNDEPCDNLAANEAAQLLKDADGTIIIVVEVPQEGSFRIRHSAAAATTAASVPKEISTSNTKEAEAPLSRWHEGAVVTGVVKKQDADTKVGMGLGTSSDGSILITSIKEGSLIDTETELEVGMIVKSINNVDVKGKSAPEAAELLKGAVGFLSIVATQPKHGSFRVKSKPAVPPKPRFPAGSFVTGIVEKEDQSTKLGLGLGASGDGSILITSIKEESMIEKETDLQVGMVVKSINNTELQGKTSQEAADILQATTGVVTILALQPKAGSFRIRDKSQEAAEVPAAAAREDEENSNDDEEEEAKSPPPRWPTVGVPVTTVIEKESAETKVGLGLGSSADGSILITSIKDDSLAADTDLKVGMVVQSINDAELAGLTSQEAAQILKEARGEVVIIASKPKPGSFRIRSPDAQPTDYKPQVTMIVETEFRAPVGMTIGRSTETGEIVITAVEPGSAADKAGLKRLMLVKKIDGTQITEQSPQQCSTLLKNAQGKVPIVVAAPIFGSPKPEPRWPTIGAPMTVVIEKKTVDTKVGLGLGSSSDGSILITSIRDSSLVAATDLEVGMVVQSINDEELAGLTAQEAAQILKEATGDVTIISSQPKPGSFRVRSPISRSAPVDYKPEVTIMVEKEFRAPVGVVVGRSSQTGDILITAVEPGSAADKAGLKRLMLVKKIDGTEITSQSPHQCSTLLRNANGKVPLVVAAPVFATYKSSTPTPAGRPSLGASVTAVIEKEDPETKVGLGLGSSADGSILITSIKEDSLASDTELEVGMIVKSINGEVVAGMTSLEAAQILKEATGEVSIIANKSDPGSFRVRAPDSAPTDYKPEVTMFVQKGFRAPVGVVIGRSSETNEIVISAVEPGSLGDKSGLKRLMLIKKINDTEITDQTPQQCSSLLRNAHGKVPLVVSAPIFGSSKSSDSPGAGSRWPTQGAPVTAVVEKDTAESKVGLGLGKSSDGSILITSIKEDSLVAGTDLEVGMIVQSINGEDLAGLTSQEAAKILKEASGEVIIIASQAEPGSFRIRTPGSPPTPSYSAPVSITVEKEFRAPVGVVIGKSSQTGEILITAVEPGSLGERSGLTRLMVIKKIDGTEIKDQTPQQCSTLLRNAHGKVPLVVASQVVAVPKAHSSSPQGGSRWPMESVVTVVIEKKTVETKVGLGLGSSADGSVLITSIKEDSLAADTDLKVGMVVKSINDEDLSGMTALEGAKVLKEASGEVTIIANQPKPGSFRIRSPDSAPTSYKGQETIVVEKEFRAPVGVVIGRSSQTGDIVITAVEPGSLGNKAGLKRLMVVKKIDGTEITEQSPKQCSTLLKNAHGKVPLVVAAPIYGSSKPAASTQEEEPRWPTIEVTAVINKETSDTKVGLGLGSSADGSILITSIKEDSLAADTDLKVGMVVKSINDEDLSAMTALEAAKVLKEASGEVTIVANQPKPGSFRIRSSNSKPTGYSGQETVVVEKEFRAPVGVTIGKSTQTGDIVLTAVEPGSLGDKAGLKRLMLVKKIDGTEIKDQSPQQCSTLLKNSHGKVALVVTRPVFDSPKPTTPLVTAVIEKENAGSKVGLGLGSSADGTILITSIKEESLASETPLEVGMVVKSINNEDLGGFTSQEAAEVLKDASGKVTILATQAKPGSFRIRSSKPSQEEETSHRPEMDNALTAVLEKEASDTKVGLGLGSSADGSILITSIKEDSLAADTDLKVGMVVKSINDEDLSGMTALEGAKVLKEASGEVTIVANQPKPGSFRIRSPDSAPTSYKGQETIVVEKEFRAPVGVTLGKSTQTGEIVITAVEPGSLGDKAGLKRLMVVKKIDGTQITTQTPQQCSTLLKNAHGKVPLVVAAPNFGSSKPSPAAESRQPMAGGPVTVLLDKETSDTKVGLGLGSSADGSILITSIKDGSLAADTDLKVGMVVQSINDEELAGLTSQEAALILKQAHGEVAIVANQPAPGSFRIRSPDSAPTNYKGQETIVVEKKFRAPVGIVLGKSTQTGEIVITAVEPGSLGAKAGLKPLMGVKKIDGTQITTQTPQQCSTLLKNAHGKVPLVVSAPVGSQPTSGVHAVAPKSSPAAAGPASNWPAGALVTAVLKKETVDSKVGLGLGSSSDGNVLITSIKEGSLVDETDLEVGMVVKSINNVDLAEKSSHEAAGVLKESTGNVIILASQPQPGSFRIRSSQTKEEPPKPSRWPAGAMVTAVVEKKSPDTKMGLGLGRAEDGSVIITSIKEDSPIADTELELGMVIKSINNTPLEGKSSQEAAKLMKDARGVLTILATQPPPGSFRVSKSKPAAQAVAEPLAAEPLAAEPPVAQAKASAEPADSSTVVAVIDKRSDSKVGLGIGRHNDGSIMITSIREGSLVDVQTDLEVGMNVKSIANQKVHGMSAKEAALLLKNATGKLTIVAHRPSSLRMNDPEASSSAKGAEAGAKDVSPEAEATQGGQSLGEAMVVTLQKESSADKVGVGLGRSEDGHLVVTSIKQEGIAAKSDLAVGMIVTKINSTDCASLSALDAARLLKNAVGNVKVSVVVPE